MNPKSGSAGNAVAPAEPAEAVDADVADPGKVEEARAADSQQKKGKGKAAKGTPQPKPHKPPSENEETTQLHWIELELKDEANQPVPGEAYEVTLPDGSVAKGTLDGKGFAKIDGIATAGNCQVTFPNLDKDAWETA
jgi:type VI secretion system secreted protein VgrG